MEGGLGLQVPCHGQCAPRVVMGWYAMTFCRRKALAEFKRTHEEVAMAEARRLLDADQWDALQAVASPASYFA